MACRTALAGLLAAALDTIGRLLETGHRELAIPEMLAVARVAQLAAVAHVRATGRLP